MSKQPVINEIEAPTVDPDQKYEKENSGVRLLGLFYDLYFLLFGISYLVGVGTGILIISDTADLWISFAGSENANNMGLIISITFSVLNAGVGLLSGLLSDFLQQRGLLTRKMYLSFLFLLYSIVFTGEAVLSNFPSENQFLQYLWASLLMLAGGFWGSVFTLFPTLIFDFYGAKNFGVCYGCLSLFATFSSFFVPFLGKLCFQYHASYTFPLGFFAVTLFTCGIGLALSSNQKSV